ncbi:STAS domain-containing protein [Thiovibrio sp. JS02]
MDIDILQEEARSIFSLRGVVDERGAEILHSHFDAVNPLITREVVVDCQDLSYIGSSGIGKFLLLYKRLTAMDGSLRVINLPRNIFTIFKELRFDTLFAISQRQQ